MDRQTKALKIKGKKHQTTTLTHPERDAQTHIDKADHKGKTVNVQTLIENQTQMEIEFLHLKKR